MNICVCVGSSCHLKGSYDVIRLLKENLEANGLTDRVNLSAAFCMGKCEHGVTVKVNDEIVTGVNADTFDAFFKEKVLGGELGWMISCV